jgi:hypothetical protein
MAGRALLAGAIFFTTYMGIIYVIIAKAFGKVLENFQKWYFFLSSFY